LGVVLYEMLAGRTPFEATSDAAVMHKIIYEGPPELSSLAPDVPPGLSAVVAHAMAKDKEERYQSVSDLLEDLRNYESLPPEKLASSTKRASTRAMSTAKQPLRKRKRIAIAAVVACVLVAAVVAGALLLRKPASVVSPEPPKIKQQIQYCTSTDGTRIAYAVVGNGPPLVRVLGWFTHLEYEWNHPVNRVSIDAYAALCKLVRFDARGMGLSEHRVSDFSLEAQVADLEAVVDDLRLERFALNGISQGGPVAITYAVRHPERVSHLILYGTFDHWWYMDTEEGRQEMAALVTLIRQGWSSDAPAHRQFFTGMFLPDATEVEYIQWFNELQRISTSAENAAALALSLPDIDVGHLLPKVKVPTLVIHRRGDRAVPFEMGKKLAMEIPGAQFLPVEGRNHAILPYEPEAQEIGMAIAEFLAETSDPAPDSENSLENDGLEK
jgi:pimeloyl-ACP methyl ester carboxylesterase